MVAISQEQSDENIWKNGKLCKWFINFTWTCSPKSYNYVQEI